MILCAKVGGVKQRITHSHNSFCERDNEHISNNFLHKIEQKLTYDLSTVRMACSKEAAEWLFPPKYVDNVVILNNGINWDSYRYSEEVRSEVRREYNIPEDTFLIGHVGRLAEQKNHKFLIGVFDKLHKEYKNTKVVDLWEENIDSADEETKSELKEEDVTEQNEEPTLSDNIDKKEQIVQEEFEQQDKSLSSLMDNIKFVDLDGVISWKMETQESWLWYSRSELLTIISDYIQHNLDDESDIVVTVQYNEKDEVEKIILKKQDKSWQQHYSSFSWDFAIDEYKESISQNDTSLSSVKLEWNRHSKALSQKDIRDAEEIFSILF